MPKNGVNLEGMLTSLWLLFTLVLSIAVFANTYNSMGLIWASALTVFIAVIMIVIAIVFKRLFER